MTHDVAFLFQTENTPTVKMYINRSWGSYIFTAAKCSLNKKKPNSDYLLL